MREHWSVIMLLIRRKMPKALCALLLVFVGGIAGACFLVPRLQLDVFHGQPFGENRLQLFLLLMAVLGFFGIIVSCLDFPGKKSNVVYTFRKLRISETSIFVWDMVIDIILFLLLWGVTALMLIWAGKYYMSLADYREGTLGLTAWLLSDEYLGRSLVPVRNPLAVLHTFLLAVCCGASCACASNALQNHRMVVVHAALLGFFAMILRVETSAWGEDKPLLSVAIWTGVAVALAVWLTVRTIRRIPRKEET